MYAICIHCHTPHKLPEDADPNNYSCRKCSDALTPAKAVMCRECYQTADGFNSRIYFIAANAKAWRCPKGHLHHKAARPGAPVWKSVS